MDVLPWTIGTDLVIGVVAHRLNTWVYSTDPHFDLIPNLKRFLLA
jgi:hypothetical protein